MFRFLAAAAGAALLALAPGAASAQDEDDGMMCVYDAIVAGDHYDIVAEAYLQDTASEHFEEAQKVVADIATACADQFDLSEDDLSATIDLGVYGVTIDYLSDNLMLMGATDDAIDAVFDAYGKLNALDAETFSDESWRTNAAFKGRLRAELLKAGVPDDAEILDTAYELMQLSAATDEIMYEFVIAGLDDEPETAEP